MNNLPENEGWAKVGCDTFNSWVSQGILTIESPHGSCLEYKATDDWLNTVNNEKGWVIETKMKVDPSSVNAPYDQNVDVWIHDKTYISIIGFNTDKIYIAFPPTNRIEYLMDTTNDFHTYRIEGKGKSIKIFVDGNLAINLVEGDWAGYYGGTEILDFGDGNGSYYSKSYWDYFYYSTTGTGTIELPRTGQTTCYDSAGAVIACAGTGQDGEIQAGVPWPDPRFTDNSDDTVTDNLTGLMWTKDANLTGATMTWQQALDYVSGMNAGVYSNFGYTDWRLPNINEMKSLIDAGRYNPALPASHPYTNVQDTNAQGGGYYWSSTNDTFYKDVAWVIGMGTGYVVVFNKSNNSSYVWAVRSGQVGSSGSSFINLPRTGQTTCYDTTGNVIPCAGTGQDGEIQAGVPWPNPRFIDNVDGTVTDNLTSLMWTKDTNLPGATMTWQQALDYVSGMNAGVYPNFGYTDWRLPNREEFLSLIDRTQVNPALPAGHPFTNVQGYFHWSSTSYVPSTVSAWVLSIGRGGAVPLYTKSDNSFYLWPVRSGKVGSIGSTEICDGIDNDLDGFTDEGFTDTDNDGQADCVDSDDDNDGYTDTVEQAAGSDPLNVASTPEVCDGLDNDLDGQIDEGLLNTYYRDADGDAYGNSAITTQACTQPSGYVSNNTDCNDSDASVKPGATEVCNGIDDNCNGQVDEGVKNTYYLDADNDTYGNSTNTTQACTMPSEYVSNSSDCNDGSSSVHPGATESCNNIDDNCDGRSDEGCPGVEVCDGVDNDMDGLTDEGCPGSPATPEGDNVEVTPTENLILTFDNVTTSGTTTVTPSGTGQPPPSGFRLGSPPVYYEITTTATYSGPIQVCLSYNENQFATEQNLRLFHLEGGAWVDITDAGYPDTTNNIICGNTTSFSPFIVAESSSSSSSTPTIVSGVSLSARMDGDQVVLTWSTGSERDNEGFIILRGESAAGPFSSITSAMIPATGGFGMRATYTFTDSSVEPGKTYYYRLQDIDGRGKITAHQIIPVTVTVARTDGASQENSNKGNNTAGASQQADMAGQKGSVEKEHHNVEESLTWVAVVVAGQEGRPPVVETDSNSRSSEDTENDPIPTLPLPLKGRESGVHSAPYFSDTQPSVAATGIVSPHPGPSTFSVSIEDDKGNIIVVRKVEDTVSASKATGDLEVTEESGNVTLTWKGRGGTKGFILHRTEKGKENYTAITSLIPYFGRDDKDIFLYKFTDNNIKPEVHYDYRLEVVKSDQIDRTAKR